MQIDRHLPARKTTHQRPRRHLVHTAASRGATLLLACLVSAAPGAAFDAVPLTLLATWIGDATFFAAAPAALAPAPATLPAPRTAPPPAVVAAPAADAPDPGAAATAAAPDAAGREADASLPDADAAAGDGTAEEIPAPAPPEPIAPAPIRETQAAELGVLPGVINLVETWGEATWASTSFRVANLGGGTLHWTLADAEPGLAIDPTSGSLAAGNSETVQIAVSLADSPPGSYSSSITLAADGIEPLVLPVNLTLTELVGENIGSEDMIDFRLIKNGVGGPGGSFGFVNGPGEPPTLEVQLDDGVAVGRLYLTPPVDLGPIRYLQLELIAPVGSWVQPILEENLAAGDQWIADPFVVYTDEVQHYRVPLVDFRYSHGPSGPRPIDLSQVQLVHLKIGIPEEGQYGYPGAGARAARLRDLRLTESSMEVAATLTAGPATVHLDATVLQGTMARPWEGITGFQDRHDALRQVGFSIDRESALNINQWETNAWLMPDIGDDRFEEIEQVYRRFDPEVEHMPWIPAIPLFLWEVPDPDIVIGGGQVDRPVYAFRPPVDYALWQDLVDDFVRAHIDLGINVRAFSILNEPDLPLFWQGTEEEAFEFFVRTAEAIKGVDPEIAIAGPSTADMPEPDELWRFLSYLYEHDTPLDYLSFHGYFESRHGSAFADAATMAREMMAAFGDHFADTQLQVNEWAYSLKQEFGQRSREPIAAAAVASAFKGMVDGDYDSALWFGLNAAGGEVFYASGLFDFDKVSARPTLYVFDFFNRLGDERVASSAAPAASGVESLAAVDPETGVVQVAVWWPASGDGTESAGTQVTLDYLLPDDRAYDWDRLVIDDEHCNLVPGLGYLPPAPVETGSTDGAAGQLDFELPLYGVTLVTFTPRP